MRYFVCVGFMISFANAHAYAKRRINLVLLLDLEQTKGKRQGNPDV
jgi:hypothetical protein